MDDRASKAAEEIVFGAKHVRWNAGEPEHPNLFMLRQLIADAISGAIEEERERAEKAEARIQALEQSCDGWRTIACQYEDDLRALADWASNFNSTLPHEYRHALVVEVPDRIRVMIEAD